MSTIWTVGDFGRAAMAVLQADSHDGLLTLTAHSPHESHCGGWEVLAWPCPPARELLDRLLLEPTTPPGGYRPCAGCDSIGDACRAIGCPAVHYSTPPGLVNP